MKRNTTIIGIVLSGILAVSAQARHDDSRKQSGKSPSAVSQKKGSSHSYSKSRGVSQKTRNSKYRVKLPRNLKRVSHRGVTYYVSHGVCYRPTRGGYVSVRRPW